MNEDSSISVCFERGGKMASSDDHAPSLELNQFVIILNETLSVVATLFKDMGGSDAYQVYNRQR